MHEERRTGKLTAIEEICRCIVFVRLAWSFSSGEFQTFLEDLQKDTYQNLRRSRFWGPYIQLHSAFSCLRWSRPDSETLSKCPDQLTFSVCRSSLKLIETWSRFAFPGPHRELPVLNREKVKMQMMQEFVSRQAAWHGLDFATSALTVVWACSHAGWLSTNLSSVPCHWKL